MTIELSNFIFHLVVPQCLDFECRYDETKHKLFHQHPNPSSCEWTHRGSHANIYGILLYIYSCWVPFINGIPISGVVFLFMIFFAVIPTVTFNVQNVYKVVQSRKGSMINALSTLVPFCVLLAVIILWYAPTFFSLFILS
ncbi:hypothetical protein L1987_27311 [Smallanthus sonchifolius]|uniref:Uncharacterized protein n=1 Tax=Smallanthus sonchifolius TaxID=185202 RepID=A0ACB9IAD8_9ASTR|nr:hypothetical protein L1987_27311 [Smallanthus sonchifolius]